MAKKVSWTRDWPKQDYTGFTPKQIRNAQRIYKKLAIIVIKAHIKRMRKKPTLKRVVWGHDKTTALYSLDTYIIKPEAKEIPKKGRNGKIPKEPTSGIGGSIVSPTPPPNP
jgi:hypothetical protein